MPKPPEVTIKHETKFPASPEFWCAYSEDKSIALCGYCSTLQQTTTGLYNLLTETTMQGVIDLAAAESITITTADFLEE